MKKQKWMPDEDFNPTLPEGWKLQERLVYAKYSYTSFVRMAKLHHRAEPTPIYVVMHEFNPHHSDFKFSVRGGRHVPDGHLRRMNSEKTAIDTVLFLMDQTDIMIEDINSKKTVDAYQRKLEKIK